MFVTIAIPAYNEEAAIGSDLDTIKEAMDASPYRYEVIVVDDGSKDHTAEIVRSRSWARLIRHVRNKGVGAARKTALREARGNVVVMTDGDGTYPNRDIPRLLEYMGRYDMVIGARKREAGSLPIPRRITKFFIRKLAEYITTFRIPDLNSGFRAFRKDLAVKFFKFLPEGHSWVSTMTICFLNHNYDVKYIPIEYYPRKGRSTFHPIHDTMNYLLLVFRTVMYFKPLKILGPAAFFLFAVAVVRTCYDAYFLHKVKESDVMLFLGSILIGVIALLADMMVKLLREE